MSYKRLSLPLAILFAAALVACGKSETPATSPASPAVNSRAADELVVKIGASAPLTGPQAHLGKDNENGTRMAIDDANIERLPMTYIKSMLLGETGSKVCQ